MQKIYYKNVLALETLQIKYDVLFAKKMSMLQPFILSQQVGNEGKFTFINLYPLDQTRQKGQTF
jgi:hypothetical protein